MTRTFPIVFTHCPWCGCPDTVAQLAVNELKEKGQVPKEAMAALETFAMPLTQPKLVGAVPLIIVRYDICAECGRRRCTRADTAIGQPQFPPTLGKKRN